MEQQLINQLVCLIRKSGGGSFIEQVLPGVDNILTHQWNAEEISSAVERLKFINDLFGKSDATVVISNLLQLYHINMEDLSIKPMA
ncbi:MAG TPA: hypothetical protein VD816_13315 [Ohtaekwangia sp.]|nr:hypothetical protein [Ohtaekwangia sp.]